MGKEFVYYSMERPVSPGTYPSDGLIRFHNYAHRSPIFSIGDAWGYAVYDRELTIEEMVHYKLKFAGEVK